MNFARNQNSEQRLSALFGLAIFSHQSCATGTLLLQKDIYPRKYSLNLRQLNFFMLLNISNPDIFVFSPLIVRMPVKIISFKLAIHSKSIQAASLL